MRASLEGMPQDPYRYVVIHRLQFLKILKYIPHTVEHQMSLLLEVFNLFWLIYSQCNNQNIYLSIMVVSIEALPWDFPHP